MLSHRFRRFRADPFTSLDNQIRLAAKLLILKRDFASRAFARTAKPGRPSAVCFLLPCSSPWAGVASGLLRLGVTQHPALRSPDFPLHTRGMQRPSGRLHGRILRGSTPRGPKYLGVVVTGRFFVARIPPRNAQKWQRRQQARGGQRMRGKPARRTFIDQSPLRRQG